MDVTHYKEEHDTAQAVIDDDRSEIINVVDAEYEPTKEQRIEDDKMVHEFATSVHTALRKSKDYINDVR